MFSFRERLTELFEDSFLSISDLAKSSGIPKSNLSQWLRFDIAPNIRGVIRLARYFKCSTDYLLGRVNDSTVCFSDEPVCFSERLTSLIAEKKITAYRASKELHIDTAMVCSWQNYNTLPNLENTLLLADYFNCSTDYLLGLTNNK